MGNAAVEPAHDDSYGIPNQPEVLDKPVKIEERKKPNTNTNKNSRTQAGYGSNGTSGDSVENGYGARKVSNGSGLTDLTLTLPSDDNDDDDDGAGDDLNLVEVIQQLLPYYGQGNSSNDSNLRAALSGLSIEDIDSKDLYGNTLLILACCYRCDDLVRIMLSKGADPSAVNNSGTCCLHFACHKESSSIAIAKALLSNGADPDVHEMQYGCTPLHYSAAAGSTECCKLLIAKGAQLGAVDYYNMTCVDYARDAGYFDVSDYLGQQLVRANVTASTTPNRGNARGGGGGYMHTTMGGMGRAGQQQAASKEWNMYYDQASGLNYYVHSTTGEAVWESEYASRLEAIRLNKSGSASQVSSKYDSPSSPAPVGRRGPGGLDSVAEMEHGKNEVIKKCLVDFLQKYDSGAVSQADELMSKHKGAEIGLLKELCAKYHANESDELNKFKTELRDFAATTSLGARNPSLLSAGTRINPAKGTPTGSSRVDPMQLQSALADERIKFETILAAEREKYDYQIAQERNKFTTLISDKDARISSLESKNSSATREKDSHDEEITNLKSALSRAQLQGGDAMAEREKEILRINTLVDTLKNQLSQANQEIDMKNNRISSLDNTLSSLTAGNEDRIAKDRAVAEDRERHDREVNAKHLSEINELEETKRTIETKARSDLATAASKLAMAQGEAEDKLNELRKAKDLEMSVLQSKFSEEKSNLTRQLSAITLELEHSKQETQEAVQRMKAAEESQASMRDEIVDARATVQLNVQLHKDLAREQNARKRLHNEMEDMKGKIRVYIRIRPMSKTEIERGCTEAVSKDGKLSLTVRGIGGKPDEKKTFDFDQIFGGAEANTQTDVFRDTKHLIMSVLDGYNVCIFAYGQTGAGKSFTMVGASDLGSCLQANGEFDASSGVTPRAIVELFRLLNERTAQITFTVEVQMFQLYRDNIDDLLAEKKKKDDSTPPLKIILAEFSDTGLVQVQGAAVINAETPQEVMKIFAKGSTRRTTASTQMNSESSRSHLICSLVVKMTNRRTKVMSLGKLTLVDLAGSERVDKSGAEGEMFKEAQSINKSLSALGDVIAALTSNQQHVPYRNHPLTMLMSDTLGGNAKTLIFINTSPADYNISETVSSLNFGTRCKDITNSVSSGPGVQLAQVNALKKELNKLKKGGPAGGGATAPKGPPPVGGK